MKCLQRSSKILWVVYKILRVSNLTIENGVVIVTAGYHPGASQFDSRGWSVFNSRFTKFVLGNRGGIIFVILAGDFNTGGPSLITVGMEYLFAFQFWCCERSVGNQWGGGQVALLLVFVIWGCFNCHWVRVGWTVQKASLEFPVLLKEMRTRRQFEILSCRFVARVMRQGESKIPLCNPSSGKILLRAFSSYNKLLGRVAYKILPKHPRWSFPTKTTSCLKKLTVSRKEHPPKR